MNRKISFGAALALLLIVAAFVFSITMNYATQTFNQRVTDLRNRETISMKYSEIDSLVRAHYYGSINETTLMNNVASGYLEGIGDKYGRYITADEYKKLMQETEGGDDVGIGAVIEIAPDDFYLLVAEVYPDSPAEVAGIEAGDLIVQIDDVDLSRDNSREMLESIQGPQGSNITIVTRRGGVDSNPHLITRRAVAVPTVFYTRLLEDSTVGYLHVSEFRERTYDQFNRALLSLVDNGATSLIVDLRDNQSDVLRSVTRILDRLVPEGVIVSAEYKDGTTEVLADSDANATSLPVVVLINERTTGVSELFAQSIKDFERGSTVGTTTAGKGLMQNILMLSDGSAIELSVAEYRSRSGYSWSNVGVKADYDVAMEADWKLYIENDNEIGDSQLVKAKEVAMSLEKSTAYVREPEEEEEDSQAETSSESAVMTPDPVSEPQVEQKSSTPDDSAGTEDEDGQASPEESGEEDNPDAEEDEEDS